MYDGTESGRYMRKMEGTLASEQRTMNKFALLLLVLLIVHSEAGDDGQNVQLPVGLVAGSAGHVLFWSIPRWEVLRAMPVT